MLPLLHAEQGRLADAQALPRQPQNPPVSCLQDEQRGRNDNEIFGKKRKLAKETNKIIQLTLEYDSTNKKTQTETKTTSNKITPLFDKNYLEIANRIIPDSFCTAKHSFTTRSKMPAILTKSSSLKPREVSAGVPTE
jgi:hypothetical protein